MSSRSPDWLPDPTYAGAAVPTKGGFAAVDDIDGRLFIRSSRNDQTMVLTPVDADGQLGTSRTIELPNPAPDPLASAADSSGRLYLSAYDLEERDHVLRRFDGASGARDTAYRPDLSANGRRNIIALAGDGDGVLTSAGRLRNRGTTDGVLYRLLADGTRDPAFADAGVLRTPREAAMCLTHRPDGSFVATFPDRTASFDAAGHADAQFGSGGAVAFPHRPSDPCPIALKNGNIASVRAASFGDDPKMELVLMTRAGAVLRRALPGAVSFGDLTERNDGAVLVGYGIRWSRLDLGLVRVEAFDSQLRPVTVAGRRMLHTRAWADLGTSGIGNMLSPILLPDGLHMLVGLRSDYGRVSYTRLALGSAAGAGQAPAAKPRVTMQLIATADSQVAAVRYSCAAACGIARVDAEVLVDGKRRASSPLLTDQRGQRFPYGTKSFRGIPVGTGFPMTVPGNLHEGDRITKTARVVIRVRVADGFGRTDGKSLGYRVRCTIAITHHTGRRACRRTSAVTSKSL